MVCSTTNFCFVRTHVLYGFSPVNLVLLVPYMNSEVEWTRCVGCIYHAIYRTSWGTDRVSTSSTKVGGAI